MSDKKTNLAWLNMEMTGLCPEKDVILQITTVVTDKDLNILAQGPDLVIHHTISVRSIMTPEVSDLHQKSGLTSLVKDSIISLKKSETLTLDFLHEWIEPGSSPICGNSICHERRFIANWMPRLSKFFHYRNVDVSSFKELISRWNPDGPYIFNNHDKTAHGRIKKSISELRHYKDNFTSFDK